MERVPVHKHVLAVLKYLNLKSLLLFQFSIHRLAEFDRRWDLDKQLLQNHDLILILGDPQF